MINKGNIIYFLGIGGIGMSALARYFKNLGKEIYGYDLTRTPLTEELENDGFKIHYKEDVNLIPDGIDFVVYTPAIPKDNKEYLYFVENDFELKKRSEVLGELSEKYFTIAVAGTHGKTSISTLAAHIIKSAGKNITALVGGISKNYNSNYISSGRTELLLLEADEYDRSFMRLSPDIAVVSSVEADHLDVYGTRNELEDTFKKFAGRLDEKGSLIYHSSLSLFDDIERNKITYSAKGKAGCVAENVRIDSGKYVFDLVYGDIKIEDITILVPGLHYVENALGAALIAFELGIDVNQIKKGVETFKGVERRFDYRVVREDFVFIDDYAHHPDEIKVTVEAVRKLYPGKKITGVFQPHLFSRTKDFAKGFAQSLENLDEIILLDIYPAREKPVKGVTSELILENIKNENKRLLKKDELTGYLKNNKPEVLLTIGAGDIGLMLNEIEKVLTK